MFVFGCSYCPANYTCLSNLGENPNFGYTNFDNFGWAMLNSFQLITLDFWEDVYNKVSDIVFSLHMSDIYLLCLKSQLPVLAAVTYLCFKRQLPVLAAVT